jgi:hypothetical protein
MARQRKFHDWAGKGINNNRTIEYTLQDGIVTFIIKEKGQPNAVIDLSRIDARKFANGINLDLDSFNIGKLRLAGD